MNDELRWMAEATGAESASKGERIQSLWSGYGELFRVSLRRAADDARPSSAIVKWVKPPARDRGGDRSHARKCRSYEVETTWYRTFAARCDERCRVARLYGSRAAEPRQQVLLLEDLDASGFPDRRRAPKAADLDLCLAWLAEFHALFMGVSPAGLWNTGTYWHLATRPDELAAIDDGALREAAPIIDDKLRRAAFQTLVHGDAKMANFCFARESDGGTPPVAAVDFQYVGGGCGMKDVAYLLTGDAGSEDAEQRHLDTYFRHLRAAITRRTAMDVEALEREWRALYPIACADFYRFLAGWAKSHWNHDLHGQRVVRNVLRALA